MNIINAIRRNWLWLTLCLLLFTISCSRNFGHHPLSWWNACWIFLPGALITWSGTNSWFIFRPLRWIHWPNQKSYLETHFSKLDKNPMVYPTLMWLEFSGEQVYVAGGMDALQKGLFGQGEKTKGALTKVIQDAVATKHICDCNDAGCGCHDNEQAI